MGGVHSTVCNSSNVSACSFDATVWQSNLYIYHSESALKLKNNDDNKTKH